MKKLFFSLTVALIALVSCAPSPMEIKEGTAAEAAQKFFTAIKDKDFTAAVAVADVSDLPGVDLLGEEKLREISANALKTAFGDYKFKDIYVTEEGPEADGKVEVKDWGATETEGQGKLAINVKKINGKWLVDWSSVH